MLTTAAGAIAARAGKSTQTESSVPLPIRQLIAAMAAAVFVVLLLAFLARCRFIIVSDAGCDPDYSFEDLSNAVRKIRIDFSIPIEFSPEGIGMEREKQGKRQIAPRVPARVDLEPVLHRSTVRELPHARPAHYRARRRLARVHGCVERPDGRRTRRVLSRVYTDYQCLSGRR
jgi:hypothetical protein